jgi:hypothetical protein
LAFLEKRKGDMVPVFSALYLLFFKEKLLKLDFESCKKIILSLSAEQPLENLISEKIPFFFHLLPF